MSDPDIVTPAGEDKSEVALAIAQQRVKQADNNRRALNMAKAYPNASALTKFLRAQKNLQLQKADDEVEEWDENIIEEFIQNIYNIDGTTGEPLITDEEINDTIKQIERGEIQLDEDAQTYYDINLGDAKEDRKSTLAYIRPTDDEINTLAAKHRIDASDMPSAFESRKEFYALSQWLDRAKKDDKETIAMEFSDAVGTFGLSLYSDVNDFIKESSNNLGITVSSPPRIKSEQGEVAGEVAGGDTDQTGEEIDSSGDLLGDGLGWETGGNIVPVETNVVESTTGAGTSIEPAISNQSRNTYTEIPLEAAPLVEDNPKRDEPLTSVELATFQELWGLSQYKRASKEKNKNFTLRRHHTIKNDGKAWELSHLAELRANLATHRGINVDERSLYGILQNIHDKDYASFYIPKGSTESRYWMMTFPANRAKKDNTKVSTEMRTKINKALKSFTSRQYNRRAPVDVGTILDSSGYTPGHYFTLTKESIADRDQNSIIALPDGTFGKVIDSKLDMYHTIGDIGEAGTVDLQRPLPTNPESFAIPYATSENSDRPPLPLQHILYQKEDGTYGFGTFAYSRDIGDFVAINNFDDELETRGTSAAGIKHVENLPDYESAVNAYTDNLNEIQATTTGSAVNRDSLDSNLSRVLEGPNNFNYLFSKLPEETKNAFLLFVTNFEKNGGINLKIQNSPQLGDVNSYNLSKLTDEELDNYEPVNTYLDGSVDYQRDYIAKYIDLKNNVPEIIQEGTDYTEDDIETWTKEEYENFTNDIPSLTEDDSAFVLSDAEVNDFKRKVNLGLIVVKPISQDGMSAPLLEDGIQVNTKLPFGSSDRVQEVGPYFNSFFTSRKLNGREVNLTYSEDTLPSTVEEFIEAGLEEEFGKSFRDTIAQIDKITQGATDTNTLKVLALLDETLSRMLSKPGNLKKYTNVDSEGYTKLTEYLDSERYTDSDGYKKWFPAEVNILGEDWNEITSAIPNLDEPFNTFQADKHRKDIEQAQTNKAFFEKKTQRDALAGDELSAIKTAYSKLAQNTIIPNSMGKGKIPPSEEAIKLKDRYMALGKEVNNTADTDGLSEVEKQELADTVFSNQELADAYGALSLEDQAWFHTMGNRGLNIPGITVNIYRDGKGINYALPMTQIHPNNRPDDWYKAQAVNNEVYKNANGNYEIRDTSEAESNLNLMEAAQKTLKTSVENLPNFKELSDALENTSGQLAITGEAVRNAYSRMPISNMDIELHGFVNESALLSEGEYALNDKLPLNRISENVFSTKDGNLTFTLVPSDGEGVDLAATTVNKTFTPDALVYDVAKDLLLDPTKRGVNSLDQNNLDIVSNNNILDNEASPYEAALLMSQFDLFLPDEARDVLASVVTNTNRDKNRESDVNKTLAFLDLLGTPNSSNGLNTLKTLGAFEKDFPALHNLEQEAWDTLVEGVSSVSSDFSDSQKLATVFNYLSDEDVKATLNPSEDSQDSILNNSSMDSSLKDAGDFHKIVQTVKDAKTNNTNLRQAQHSYTSDKIENALEVLKATKEFTDSDVTTFKNKIFTYTEQLKNEGATEQNALASISQIQGLLDLAKTSEGEDRARDIQNTVINYQINNRITTVQQAEEYIKDNYNQGEGTRVDNYAKPPVNDTDRLDAPPSSSPDAIISLLDNMTKQYRSEDGEVKRNANGKFNKTKGIGTYREALINLIESNPEAAAEIIRNHGDLPYTYNQSIEEKYQVGDDGTISERPKGKTVTPKKSGEVDAQQGKEVDAPQESGEVAAPQDRFTGKWGKAEMERFLKDIPVYNMSSDTFDLSQDDLNKFQENFANGTLTLTEDAENLRIGEYGNQVLARVETLHNALSPLGPDEQRDTTGEVVTEAPATEETTDATEETTDATVEEPPVVKETIREGLKRKRRIEAEGLRDAFALESDGSYKAPEMASAMVERFKTEEFNSKEIEHLLATKSGRYPGRGKKDTRKKLLIPTSVADQIRSEHNNVIKNIENEKTIQTAVDESNQAYAALERDYDRSIGHRFINNPKNYPEEMDYVKERMSGDKKFAQLFSEEGATQERIDSLLDIEKLKEKTPRQLEEIEKLKTKETQAKKDLQDKKIEEADLKSIQRELRDMQNSNQVLGLYTNKGDTSDSEGISPDTHKAIFKEMNLNQLKKFEEDLINAIAQTDDTEVGKENRNLLVYMKDNFMSYAYGKYDIPRLKDQTTGETISDYMSTSRQGGYKNAPLNQVNRFVKELAEAKKNREFIGKKVEEENGGMTNESYFREEFLSAAQGGVRDDALKSIDSKTQPPNIYTSRHKFIEQFNEASELTDTGEPKDPAKVTELTNLLKTLSQGELTIIMGRKNLTEQDHELNKKLDNIWTEHRKELIKKADAKKEGEVGRTNELNGEGEGPAAVTRAVAAAVNANTVVDQVKAITRNVSTYTDALQALEELGEALNLDKSVKDLINSNYLVPHYNDVAAFQEKNATERINSSSGPEAGRGFGRVAADGSVVQRQRTGAASKELRGNFIDILYDYDKDTRTEGFQSRALLDSLFHRGWSKDGANETSRTQNPYGVERLKSAPGSLYEMSTNPVFMEGVLALADALLESADEDSVGREEVAKRLLVKAHLELKASREGQTHNTRNIVDQLNYYKNHHIVTTTPEQKDIIREAFDKKNINDIVHSTNMRMAEWQVQEVFAGEGKKVTITPASAVRGRTNIAKELGFDSDAIYNASNTAKLTETINDIYNDSISGNRLSRQLEMAASGNYTDEQLDSHQYMNPKALDKLIENQRRNAPQTEEISHNQYTASTSREELPPAGATFAPQRIAERALTTNARTLLKNKRFMGAATKISNHMFVNFTDEQIANSGTKVGGKDKRVLDYVKLMIKHATEEAKDIHGISNPTGNQIIAAFDAQMIQAGIPKDVYNNAFSTNTKNVIRSTTRIAENRRMLSEMGYVLSATRARNSELGDILEISDVHEKDKALHTFTRRAQKDYKTLTGPEYKQTVADFIKQHPPTTDEERERNARLRSGKNMTLKQANEIMNTHTKEVLASEQRATQTNRDFARKDADRINDRIIDPDISPEDATEQYKEIHELLGQHEEHLTASQRKKLLDRASSLKNDYDAYTTQIDAALVTQQRIKDNYDDWLRENPSATTAEKRSYKQANPNYIGSDEYHNDLAAPVSSEVGNHATETEKHSTGIKDARASQRAMDAEYEVTNGDEHRANRSLAAKHGGYNSFVKVGTDGKATHTVLKGADGRSTTVTEKNGRHEAHHDDYSDFGHPEAKNKYNADNKDARPDNIGYHPELSGDTLLAGAAKQYAQARKDHEDSGVNSPERASAQRTINAIEKSYPNIKDVFNGMKERGTHLDSKTALEEARKARGDAPSAAPVSKETGEVLVWAPGIGHWVLPETLQRLNSDPNYQQGLLMKQADFIKHLQGELKQDENGNYLDANNNVIPNFNPLTDKSHKGDIYIHGKSGQLIGVNRNSDGTKELSHHDALSAGLGKVANKIGGEAETFTKNADGSFSGGTHMHDAETAHIGHLDHIAEQLSRSTPRQSLQSRLNRSMAQSTVEGFKGVMMDRNNPLGAVMRTAAPLVVATGIADRVAGMAKKFNLV